MFPGGLKCSELPPLPRKILRFRNLDSGERAAILLAESIGADLLLIDERAGAMLAQRRGLAVTGTLGILDLASRAGLLRLREAFVQLRKTNFRYPPSLMETLLEEERKRGERELK